VNESKMVMSDVVVLLLRLDSCITFVVVVQTIVRLRSSEVSVVLVGWGHLGPQNNTHNLTILLLAWNMMTSSSQFT
jgi:hypothetical protein